MRGKWNDLQTTNPGHLKALKKVEKNFCSIERFPEIVRIAPCRRVK